MKRHEGERCALGSALQALRSRLYAPGSALQALRSPSTLQALCSAGSALCRLCALQAPPRWLRPLASRALRSRLLASGSSSRLYAPGSALSRLCALQALCSPGSAFQALRFGLCAPGSTLQALRSGHCAPGTALQALLSRLCATGSSL